MRLIIYACIGVYVSGFILEMLNDNEVMRHCLLKHSYDVCFYALNH